MCHHTINSIYFGFTILKLLDMKKAVKISFASMCAILVAGCLFLMGCTPSKKGDLKIADTFLCHDTVRLKATDSMVVKESFGMWNWRASDDHIVFCTSGNVKESGAVVIAYKM